MREGTLSPAVAAAVIVLGGLAAYHNSLGGPFVFDDLTGILNNPDLHRGWGWDAIFTAHGGLTLAGRPVAALTLAGNYAFGGTTVRGYHLVNLAIHLLAGLTLFGIVRRTLLRLDGKGATPAAMLAALLWTVHPLQTEAVTYVIQRTESLMGFLYLLTLYSFIRYTESGTPAAKAWAGLSIFACYAGMGTKEVMATAPIAVFLYDRTFLAGTFAQAWRRHHRLHAGLMAGWVLLAGMIATTGWNRGGTAGASGGISTAAYALTQVHAVAHYLRLCLWPHPLIFDYGIGLATGLPEVLPGALLLGALLALTAAAVAKNLPVGYAGAWFFLTLAPSSSVIPVVTQIMAEHRMYLALAAVTTLAAAGLRSLLDRRAIWAGLLLAGTLTVLTISRNEVYSTSVRLWSDTVERRPDNQRARNNLGSIFLSQGRRPEAIAQLETALELQPDFADAHANLGDALAGSGRISEAMAHYQTALRLKPEFPEAHFDLGNLLSDSGRLSEAIEEYRRALRQDPELFAARENLGNALARTGRLPEAIEQYETILRRAPSDAETHANLANALAEDGRPDQAIGHYEAALRLRPDFAEAHHNLGVALCQVGRIKEGIGQVEEALRLSPSSSIWRQDLRHLESLLAAHPSE